MKGIFLTLTAVFLFTFNSYASNQALYFDGSDYITVPDSENYYFEKKDFTISLWLKFSHLNNYGIMGQYLASSQPWWLIDGNVSDKELRFRCHDGTIGTEMIHFTMAWTPTVNTWYHLAFMRKDNNWFIVKA